MRDLVPTIESPADWAPLEAYVDVGAFQRTGTFLEVHDWPGYREMLTMWASTISSFETTVRRIAEVDGRLVYYEIEERHHRNDTVDVLNSMTVFEFDADGRICRLDVYMQRAR